LKCAVNSFYSFEEVLIGLLPREEVSKPAQSMLEAYRARGPPKDGKKTVKIFGLTGGGEATTTFVWRC